MSQVIVPPSLQPAPMGRPRTLARPTVAATPAQLLLAVAMVLTLAVGAALGLMIWQLRQNTLMEARLTMTSLSTAIAEQTSRSIQAADIVLQDLRNQFADRHLGSVEDFKTALGSKATFGFLKDRADILPQVDALTLIGADGRLVNFSRQWPPPPTDLSDRDYMAYFRDHNDAEAFVSMPVNNRGNGLWTCYVVRRINAPSGAFIGLALAAIDLGYFRDFFRDLTEKARTSVTLIRRDGTVLTSYPDTARQGQTLPPGTGWHKMVAAGSGVLESKDTLAPGRQLVAVHPLSDYPLVINVSVRKSTVLTDWVRTSTIICLAAFVTFLCFAFLIREQMRQFSRVQRSEALLATRNAALQTTQRTLRQQAEELSTGRARMAEQSATLQGALRHMNQGIVMVNAEGRVVVCNDRAAALLDLPPEFAAGRPSFGDLMAHLERMGDFDDPAARVWKLTYDEALAAPPVYERTRLNGTILQVQTVPMEGGGLVRTYTDVTERRRTEQQVRFLARHDAVTGLYNRAAFGERFEALLADAARDGHQLGVFYIDLDGFKQVNDTHGHGIGDRLLAAVATRLKASIRETDIIARMGGDEFAVLQPFRGPGANVCDLAQRMLDAIAEPYRFEAVRCSISLSIGVALFPAHGEESAGLLQHADTALYRAKAAGKARFCVYDPAIDQASMAAVPLEHDLAQAIAEEQLYLEYQPIVDTRTLVTVRYEALLRWRHPVRGLVPVSEFIPVAEEKGLMVEIGLWVLETACRTALAWPDAIGLSVNLSPRQFVPGDLAERVEEVLVRTGLAPGRLNLEITEGVILEESAAVVAAMTRLRSLGVEFSLDDFGTAYAGLTYLRSFSFDVLKIDKSFVQDAVRTRASRNLLTAIQAIGKACKLQVVAEGIETEEELALVRELRCDHVQGYLLGRPAVSVGTAV